MKTAIPLKLSKGYRFNLTKLEPTPPNAQLNKLPIIGYPLHLSRRSTLQPSTDLIQLRITPQHAKDRTEISPAIRWSGAKDAQLNLSKPEGDQSLQVPDRFIPSHWSMCPETVNRAQLY